MDWLIITSGYKYSLEWSVRRKLEGEDALLIQIYVFTYLFNKHVMSMANDLSPLSDWQMSFSRSMSAYKHTALDKPSGCPSTTVMQTMQVPVMLLKTAIWCLVFVQFKAQVQTHTMPFTLIVQVGGASWLKKRGQLNDQRTAQQVY